MTATPTTPTLSDLSGAYAIDPAHSEIGFTARHAMVTKVRGRFDEFDGSGTVDGDDFTRSSVNLTIEVASIDTRNAQRDGHLRSNDFLSIEEFPQITFRSTSIAKVSDTSLELTGDLTIKGVTNAVTVPFEYQGQATDPFGNVRAGFEGSTSINRKDYGVTWNAPLETGGVLVSDKINLEFEISAIRSA